MHTETATDVRLERFHKFKRAALIESRMCDALSTLTADRATAQLVSGSPR